MAVLWIDSDVPALVRLASLLEFVSVEGPRAPVLAEIRQLEDRFGLSPLARRRLAWEIAQAGGSAESATGGKEEEGRWLRAVSD
jgi:hypothetical protein